MKEMFEEYGLAAFAAVVTIIVLTMFMSQMVNPTLTDVAIDFSNRDNQTIDQHDVYDNPDTAYFDDTDTASVKFRINPVTLAFNSDFNWRDYIKYKDGDNYCYATLNGKDIDLTSFVTPEDYIKATDISSIDAMLINTRKAIPQSLTYVLNWEGVSVKQTVYFDVEPNPNRYNISGRLIAIGSQTEFQFQRLTLYDGEDDYMSVETDENGFFTFSDIREGEYTLRTNYVQVHEDGTYDEKEYVMNIPMAYFDEAIDNSADVIALGNVTLQETVSFSINSVSYMLPSGSTWSDFIDLGFSQSDGEFIQYGTKPVIAVYVPVDMNIESHSYVDVTDTIQEGAYHIALMTKEDPTSGKQVNYFGIYR